MSELSLRERQEDVISHLEDGSYRQGRRALKQKLDDGSVGYCCMGVATDRFHVLTGRGEWDEFGDFVLDGKSYSAIPPEEVVEFFGFAPFVEYRLNGAFVATGEETGFGPGNATAQADGTHLYYSTSVNDNGGTFAEIAAIWRRPEAKVFREE